MTIRKTNGSLAPYPGHGTRPSPQQGPRVKSEGEPYFVRGQGEAMKRTFKANTGRDNNKNKCLEVEGRPVSRCPSSAGRNNYKHGWHGTIPPLLNGSASPRPYTAPARIKPEAEDTASIGRGKRMKVIVNEYARSFPTPRQPRVKPEASSTAHVSKGGRMHTILHKYGTQPQSSSARGVPRVKPEAESYFLMSQGRAMSQSLRFDGKPFYNPRPESRVKPEAAQSANLGRGGRMKNIFVNYGRGNINSTRSSMPARVKSEGESNAFLDRGVRMSKLLHDPGSIPSARRPASRNLSTQAKENAYKGRGSVDKVFRNIGKTTFIYKPGLQKGSLVFSTIE